MCTWFSALMRWNERRIPPEELQRNFKRAVSHLKFVTELYEMQVEGGRYFAHEHPAGASSWQQACIVNLIAKYPDIQLVTNHMCQFGMAQRDRDGISRPVLKPTRWMTNCQGVAEELDRQCPRDHQHTILVGGRAKAAEIYPPALCRAIARGVRKHIEQDNHRDLTRQGKASRTLSSRCNDISGRYVTAPAPAFNLELLAVDVEDDGNFEEEIDESEWEAEDDVRGGKLSAGEVFNARKRELDYLIRRGVYTYSTTAEARRVTNRAPIGLKWIDTNKGSVGQPNIRSRLVCTEVRRKGTEAVFSATPPLETLRAIVAKAASTDKGADPIKLSLVDVSRAHFYADAVRDVFIKLPAEDPKASESGVCGKLRKTMYGTLDAAERWGAHYAKVLVDAGFVQGRASPCLFHHPGLDIWMLVHGDDFFFAARREGREHTLKVLEGAYEVKHSTIGPQDGDLRGMRVLGRLVSYQTSGIQLEPDASYVEEVVVALELNSANGVITPGVRETLDSTISQKDLTDRRTRTNQGFPAAEAEAEVLEGDRLKRYQSTAALLNYLALDRPDIAFAVKELMRRMAGPTLEDETALKRVGRYLLKFPRLVNRFAWQPLSRELTVFVDADHAGCHRTRKSTTGGAILLGPHFLKSWSRTIPIICLSSGESELAAVVRGAQEGLGLQACLADFGWQVNIALKSDATAAIGMCRRLGLGRVRHLATADLWVQQRIRMGHFTIEKWPGTQNPSDLGTKHKGRDEIVRFCTATGHHFERGRSPYGLIKATPVLEMQSIEMADHCSDFW